ncbi:5-bromo-4-chloroindolyl phosphate hydrolysis family protein [Bacillus haynesii]|uniref:5-bromo-4-chloroindolyl phosphate hydrolysis family protein n=1 Tax=Bacillus haynesii TaxID=1925021 RepID=UPI00228167A8|nr:5-bromo-4-chloroindolyl phosphate hydrolysis family protein [Bacillus haynesii]MCY7772364.1 5-bromo-4-chloroindolyl phosphate hydrolysis family protein [Bacillus haynesii]MCY8002511.1 5-bromo-4-chloroindolyl phosphate hydrolysis family protein [Bacillus haynesii]MCY9218042.1 5-bromo-4-chloroindolyl phosphate hydrolysis family protein [Bacillus haynesii]MEC0723101.1 5-bromo-4-chloroindolyl phosphate hydrolysis family protein [Bacillus haynesii]MEC0785699.1 5-bromo-4-chloroindolyl phosphate h
MKPILHFMLRATAASALSVLLWFTSFFALNQTFLLSSAYAAGAWVAVYLGGKWYGTYLFLRENQLTRREYAYIKQNLREAKLKIARLRKALFAVKNIQTIKQNIEILRIVRKIYSITKNEPKRFYQVERFYYQSLDSIVELTEKHAFLGSQPKRNAKLEVSLSETRMMIDKLAKQLEDDLYDLLKTDIDHLEFELDVAKHSMKKS